MNTIDQLVHQLTATPALAIVMTVSAYMIALSVFRWLGEPAWAPPMLTGSLILSAMIALLPIDYDDFAAGAYWLALLLGPATVALAVPLFEQFQQIKRLILPLTVSLTVGAFVAAGSTVGIGYLMGLSPAMLESLAPKAVTTPIAVGISAGLGGIATLTVGVVTITGILAASVTPWFAQRLRCTDPRVLGFALGINGHGVATARGFSIGPQVGAFASLAMGLNGAFSALVLPLCAHWLL